MSMVLAVEVATKCKLPLRVDDNGRERVIMAARNVERFKRVYLVFADAPDDEIDVPMGCHFGLVEEMASPPTPLRAERGDKQGGFVKKGKRMAVQEYGNGVMIDRSRVTHGEMNRATVMRIEAQRAERDLDAEKVAQILTELDKLVMKVIVSVPLGWLPEGVTLDDPDWISKVSAERYEELTKLANGPQPGEKKA